MGKVDRKGRSKTEPFIKIHRGVTGSEAWKSLTCEARCLLLEIWARHNGLNNGQIPYSHREGLTALRVGGRKVTAAFRQLQDRGFLVRRTESSFDWKSHRATEWEITTEPCDEQLAKRIYRDWQNSDDGDHTGCRRRPRQLPCPA